MAIYRGIKIESTKNGKRFLVGYCWFSAESLADAMEKIDSVS